MLCVVNFTTANIYNLHKLTLTCDLKNYMTAETKYIDEYQLKMFYISFLNTQYGGTFEEERPIF